MKEMSQTWEEKLEKTGELFDVSEEWGLPWQSNES
jgi:hypothetical protein